jgi:hypothetical protein
MTSVIRFTYGEELAGVIMIIMNDCGKIEIRLTRRANGRTDGWRGQRRARGGAQANPFLFHKWANKRLEREEAARRLSARRASPSCEHTIF